MKDVEKSTCAQTCCALPSTSSDLALSASLLLLLSVFPSLLFTHYFYLWLRPLTKSCQWQILYRRIKSHCISLQFTLYRLINIFLYDNTVLAVFDPSQFDVFNLSTHKNLVGNMSEKKKLITVQICCTVIVIQHTHWLRPIWDRDNCQSVSLFYLAFTKQALHFFFFFLLAL